MLVIGALSGMIPLGVLLYVPNMPIYLVYVVVVCVMVGAFTIFGFAFSAVKDLFNIV